MSRAALVPRSVMERKPPHGQPCTRCGACCIVVLCPLAQAVFGFEQGPCPALEFDDDRNSSCGLIAHPEQHDPVRVAAYGRENVQDASRHLIGSGNGCCARFNGEPEDKPFNRRMDALDLQVAETTTLAKRVWGLIA